MKDLLQNQDRSVKPSDVGIVIEGKTLLSNLGDPISIIKSCFWTNNIYDLSK